MNIEETHVTAGKPELSPEIEEAAAARKRARKKISVRMKAANANIRSAVRDLGITEAFADTELTYGVVLYLKERLSSATFRARMKSAGAEWIGPADEHDTPVAVEPSRPIGIEDRTPAEMETRADVLAQPRQPISEVCATREASAVDMTDTSAMTPDMAKPLDVATSSETLTPLAEQIWKGVVERGEDRVAATDAASDPPGSAEHFSEDVQAPQPKSDEAPIDPAGREVAGNDAADQRMAPPERSFLAPRMPVRPGRPTPATYPSKATPPEDQPALPA